MKQKVVNIPPKYSWLGSPLRDLCISSAPAKSCCQLQAKHDWGALFEWLAIYSHRPNTQQAYRRDGVRFLLWCESVAAVSLAELNKSHLEKYFAFIQNPPKYWCSNNKSHGAERKPFNGPLKLPSVLAALRILNSFFNYLIEASYLSFNPLRLIKKFGCLTPNYHENKYQVLARILELDEWQAIQKVLQDLPENNRGESWYKLRSQLLVALLYFLALRANEVATHCWSNFRERDGKWWFFVQGKGGRSGHVPVNAELLEVIKKYRLFLGKSPHPVIADKDPLLVDKDGKKIGRVRIYQLIKELGIEAAKLFPDNQDKQARLKAMSPHWLRHLAASHQAQLNMPVAMIKENMRHVLPQTTHLYIHTEDDERFAAIQKMQINVFKPQEDGAEVESANICVFSIALRGGPVSRSMGLARIWQSLKHNIFKTVKWHYVGGDEDAWCSAVESKESGCLEVKIQVESAAIRSNPGPWINAIKRVAGMWLFSAEIIVS